MRETSQLLGPRRRAPAPPVTAWLQLPALRRAGWMVDFVGQSFNPDAIEEVSGAVPETEQLLDEGDDTTASRLEIYQTGDDSAHPEK